MQWRKGEPMEKCKYWSDMVKVMTWGNHLCKSILNFYKWWKIAFITAGEEKVAVLKIMRPGHAFLLCGEERPHLKNVIQEELARFRLSLHMRTRETQLNRRWCTGYRSEWKGRWLKNEEQATDGKFLFILHSSSNRSDLMHSNLFIGMCLSEEYKNVSCSFGNGKFCLFVF